MISSLLAFIGGLAPKLVSMYVNYANRKQAIELEKLKAQNELLKVKTELGYKLGEAQLKASGEALKWFIIAIYFIPIVLVYIEALLSALKMMFGLEPLQISVAGVIANQLNVIPEWQIQTATILALAVWGIQTGAAPIANVFKNISTAWRVRRDTIKYKALDREALFQSLRERYGKLDQKFVDSVNESIDRATRPKEED